MDGQAGQVSLPHMRDTIRDCEGLPGWPHARHNRVQPTRFQGSRRVAPRGDMAEIPAFNLREALGADLAWICAEADAVAVLPGWENSLGAAAEVATARALGLPVWKLRND